MNKTFKGILIGAVGSFILLKRNEIMDLGKKWYKDLDNGINKAIDNAVRNLRTDDDFPFDDEKDWDE